MTPNIAPRSLFTALSRLVLLFFLSCSFQRLKRVRQQAVEVLTCNWTGGAQRRRGERFIISYSCEIFHSPLQSSTILLPVIACFAGRILATNVCLLAVETSQGRAIDHLLTFCTGRLPRLIFLAFSSCWFMAFPYVAIKLLESHLRDELMPLKYISVSCPLMVLFKNKGGVRGA